MNSAHSPKIEWLDREAQESIAASVHKNPRFGNKFPFDVELFLTAELGYDICPTAGLEESCNVDTALIACKKLIRIQEQTYLENEARARMSLAHELAHLLLHGSYISYMCERLKKARKTDDYRPIIRSLPPVQANLAEQQAFFTAGAILAPYEILRQELVGFIAKEVQIGSALDDKAANRLMRHLGSYFGITPTAVMRRVELANLLGIVQRPRQTAY